MAAKAYKPGASARFSVEITTAGGADFDPDVVTLTLRQYKGSGSITTTTPVKDSVGNYHVDVVIPMDALSGQWVARWQATGAVAASNGIDESQFAILPLAF